MTPLPNDSVIPDNQPLTFSWILGIPGEWHSVEVSELDGEYLWWWGDFGGSVESVEYDGPALLPGYTYDFDVNMVLYDDPQPSDERVWVSTQTRTFGRFRIYVDPVSIEGKMHVSGGGGTYFLEGDSHNRTFCDVEFSDGDISPHADRMAYSVDDCCLTGAGWPDMVSEVWAADLDGANAVNLTAAAGLGGVNCLPQWSPDGSMIAFQHSEGGAGGVLPCDVGFHMWVMNADGTDAHRVTPEGSASTAWGSWAPNGYRLLMDMEGTGMVAIDTDGTDLEVLAGVSAGAVWRPDGASLVSSRREPGIVADEPGVWRQLRLTDPDGSNPVTLDLGDQWFLKNGDAEAYLQTMGVEPTEEALESLQWQVGPLWPEWSPSGESIAFIAAVPLNPQGPHYRQQWEVWLYDLGTTEVSRATYDWGWTSLVSWVGPNTSLEDPVVTVDNTTVTFAGVPEGGEGLTTIIRDDDPPGPTPEGFQFMGEYYDISTTVTLDPDSNITIEIHYDDADVPGGEEEWLSLMHWEVDHWVDITVRPINTVDNIITGECTSLSAFGIAKMEEPVFGGFRQPINPDGSSVFKAGRTIPVKFRLTTPLGETITDAVCYLETWKVSGEILGSVPETAEAAYADVGDTFRYHGEEGQYIYNLSTKGMDTGTWMLRVTMDGLAAFESTVLIGLR